MPDLAVSLPAPTDGGKTYTFRLRPNIRYSNGKPVRASDVRSTLERNFALGSPTLPYYEGIVGTARCKESPKRCDLSRGIVADDTAQTVTFHLVASDPEFLYKLTLPSAYVVPAGTPVHAAGSHPLPATGPYMIASYRPKHFLRLVRNPYFHEWSKAAQPDGYPDEIVVQIGGTADDAIGDVIRGKADLVSTWWSGDALPGPAGGDQDPVREPGAHEPDAIGGGSLPQHPSCTLQPSRRAQGAELRCGSHRGGRCARRTRRRPSNVSDPAPALPGLPSILPLHRRFDDTRRLEGAGSRQGAGARRTLRNAGHEDHCLRLRAGRKASACTRSSCSGRWAIERR